MAATELLLSMQNNIAKNKNHSNMTNQNLKNLLAAILTGSALTAMAQAPTLPSPDTQEKGEPLFKNVAEGRLTSQDYAHMELQFNTSGHVVFDNGEYSSGNFSVNGVKLQISGQLADGLGYVFRESFTKRPEVNSTDNVSMALEKAFVTWNATDHLQLAFGKQYIEIGGYEYWQTSNRIRFYSDFNSTIRCAQTGLGAYIKLSPDQTVALQLVNNSCASDMDVYQYGFPETLQKTKTPVMGVLGYRGYFADRTFALHYGAAYGQLARNRQQLYLTAGHEYRRGPVLAYFDVMYAREGIDTKGIISGYSEHYASDQPDFEYNVAMHTAQNVEYLSFIADLDYRLSQHFNTYVKGAYETGRVYRDNGIFMRGRYHSTHSVQACVEYFPIKDRDLRFFLHGVYKKTSLTQLGKKTGADPSESARISIGLEYILPVF